jgi:hypothetical protein
MKDYFLWAMAVLIPLSILGLFLWKLGQTIYGFVQDRKLYRELDELQRLSETKRRQEREEQKAAAEIKGQVDYTNRI